MKKAFVVSAACALLAVAASAKTGGALALVPNDAVTVGVVRLSDMRSSPLSSALFQQTDKITTDGDAAKFLQDAGFQPSRDIDVVVVSTTPDASLSDNANVLIAAEGRFNVDRLTSALIARGAKKNGAYLVLPNERDSNRTGAVAFLNPGLAVIGNEAAVTGALANYANGGTSFVTASGLGRELSRVDPKATAWALVDVTRAQRMTGGPHIASHNEHAQAMNSALKHVSTIAIWATDSGDQLKLGAVGLSSDSETLGLLEDTIRGALSAMRLAVQDKNPEMVTVLRRFTVSRSDDSVSISGSVPAETFKEYARKAATK